MLRGFSEDLVIARRMNFPLQVRYAQETKANNLIMSYMCTFVTAVVQLQHLNF